ncbi:nucleotide exchange factor GrpE [Ruminococcaceae bacterium OttesenSCG-928-I18]|nr:nucleotide exchange factor GrpE [Ruminococcaceae bacterium OttesenSCG-928-I18]
MTEAENLRQNEPTGEPLGKKEKPKKAKRAKKENEPHVETETRKESAPDKILEAEARIAAAEAKLAEAEARTAELNERLMRTAAEYENHRKRSARETESAFKNGVCFSAEELLPVLDTLNTAANVPTTDEEYKKGVLLTLAKCEEVFGKLGISEIEAEGKAFDPELHNAVMQKPADGAESGTITVVMQKGYKLGERVIRHAMVAVAP